MQREKMPYDVTTVTQRMKLNGKPYERRRRREGGKKRSEAIRSDRQGMKQEMFQDLMNRFCIKLSGEDINEGSGIKVVNNAWLKASVFQSCLPWTPGDLQTSFHKIWHPEWRCQSSLCSGADMILDQMSLWFRVGLTSALKAIHYRENIVVVYVG
ncbi:uncharacterized protein V6R79_015025 [Siganus canaliculatus]